MTQTLSMPRPTLDGLVRASAVDSDALLPRETDVVIVGGGLTGVFAAYFLGLQGVRVCLFEKGHVAGEASGRAFGWVTELLGAGVKLPAMQESKRLWTQVQKSVGDLGWRADGHVYLCESQDEADGFEAWAAASDTDGRMLNADELARRFPSAARGWSAGLFSPTDGGVEPQIAAPKVAEAARRLGAKLFQRCAVRGLQTSGGRVCGVVTERGPVRASTVIVAGGIWTRLLCGSFGVLVPQLYFLLTQGRTGRIADGPVGCGGTEAWAWRRQIDGSYALGRTVRAAAPLTRDAVKLAPLYRAAYGEMKKMLSVSLGKEARDDWMTPRRWALDRASPFEARRVFDPGVDKTAPDTALALLAQRFPAFAAARVVERWAGAISVTPDDMPIVSAVDTVPGLYLATGVSFGVTMSPSMGKLAADLVTGETPSIDPAPYRFDRFKPGNPIAFAH